jgi:hypothetical protein
VSALTPEEQLCDRSEMWTSQFKESLFPLRGPQIDRSFPSDGHTKISYCCVEEMKQKGAVKPCIPDHATRTG